jgi:hypothetical protein
MDKQFLLLIVVWQLIRQIEVLMKEGIIKNFMAHFVSIVSGVQQKEGASAVSCPLLLIQALIGSSM